MAQYITAHEAKRLRQARNTIRGYARRSARGSEIDRARYERAVALVAAHRLSGAQIRHDGKSQPLPINNALDV